MAVMATNARQRCAARREAEAHEPEAGRWAVVRGRWIWPDPRVRQRAPDKRGAQHRRGADAWRPVALMFRRNARRRLRRACSLDTRGAKQHKNTEGLKRCSYFCLTACSSAAPHINSCCRGEATRQQSTQSLRRLQQLLVRQQSRPLFRARHCRQCVRRAWTVARGSGGSP